MLRGTRHKNRAPSLHWQCGDGAAGQGWGHTPVVPSLCAVSLALTQTVNEQHPVSDFPSCAQSITGAGELGPARSARRSELAMPTRVSLSVRQMMSHILWLPPDVEPVRRAQGSGWGGGERAELGEGQEGRSPSETRSAPLVWNKAEAGQAWKGAKGSQEGGEASRRRGNSHSLGTYLLASAVLTTSPQNV